MEEENFLTKYDISPTPLRIEIIKILQTTDKPISYDEFLAKITANKTTIYRNLDLLLSKNLIVKNEIDHKSFYELADHAKAYFVCETCHKIEEIKVPVIPGKNIKSAVVKGLCESCK